MKHSLQSEELIPMEKKKITQCDAEKLIQEQDEKMSELFKLHGLKVEPTMYAPEYGLALRDALYNLLQKHYIIKPGC